jgi:hypothetical protein
MQADNRQQNHRRGLWVRFSFSLGRTFRFDCLFPFARRFNEKYLVTGGNDIQVKIWDLQALVDFQNDDSHPFLLTTLPVTVFP